MATTINLSITGMRCAGCVEAVEKALIGVAGVQQVTVSLEQHKAMIEGSAPAENLIAAVNAAGYQAVKTDE